MTSRASIDVGVCNTRFGGLFGLDASVDVRACDVGGSRAGLQRLIHDLADGASTPPTLRAAAETAINLPARDRPLVAATGGANVVVREHIAGTNDHLTLRIRLSGRDDEYDIEYLFAKEKRSLH